jgi:endonuclease III
VHRQLLEYYGRPNWETKYAPLEELVGTILSQHTSDANSERAFAALMATYSSWESVRDAPVDELTATIRAGGLAVVKAHRIQAVVRMLTGVDGLVQLPDLRRMRRKRAMQLLTSLPGVGRKTAACVLLFGAHVAAIPVDTHVHRVSLRLGLVPPRTSPEATSDALETAIDPRDSYAFHVNLIHLGREICKASRPRCEVCPLSERCATSRRGLAIAPGQPERYGSAGDRHGSLQRGRPAGWSGDSADHPRWP